MGSTKDQAIRVVAALSAVLPSGVSVSIRRVRGTIIHLRIGKKILKARWIGEGRLRHIREVLDDRGGELDIVVGRRLSPGAIESLREAGLGWVDETGAAEVVIGDLIVSRTGVAEPPENKDVRWTLSSIGVAEAILTGTRPTVSEVTKVTGLSTGSCVQALKDLATLGLLEAGARRGRGSGRRLTDPDRLLDGYVKAVRATRPPKSIRVGVVWRDMVVELAERGAIWDADGIAWAATGVAAAAVVTPLITSFNTAEVYVAADSLAQLRSVAERIGLKPIEGGRLSVTSFPAPTTSRLTTKIGDLRVSPWPRIFADLEGAGVRGEEAAEHLREVCLDR